MSSRKDSGQSWLFTQAGAIIFAIIVLMIVFINFLQRRFSPVRDVSTMKLATPIVVVTKNEIEASFTVISKDCKDESRVYFAMVNLYIAGGIPPYQLRIINSKSEILGPFIVNQTDIPVTLKVFGGDTFTAEIISQDNKEWKGKITVPSTDPFCQLIANPPPEPTNTIPATIPQTVAITASATEITIGALISTPTKKDAQNTDITPELITITALSNIPPTQISPSYTPEIYKTPNIAISNTPNPITNTPIVSISETLKPVTTTPIVIATFTQRQPIGTPINGTTSPEPPIWPPVFESVKTKSIEK